MWKVKQPLDCFPFLNIRGIGECSLNLLELLQEKAVNLLAFKCDNCLFALILLILRVLKTLQDILFFIDSHIDNFYLFIYTKNINK